MGKSKEPSKSSDWDSHQITMREVSKLDATLILILGITLIWVLDKII